MASSRFEYNVDCPALQEAFAADIWLSHNEAELRKLSTKTRRTRTQLINYWARHRRRRLKSGEAIFPEPNPGSRALKLRATLAMTAAERKQAEKVEKAGKRKYKRRKGGRAQHARNTRGAAVALPSNEQEDSESDTLTDLEELEEYLARGEYENDEMIIDEGTIQDQSMDQPESSPEEPLSKRVRFSFPIVEQEPSSPSMNRVRKPILKMKGKAKTCEKAAPAQVEQPAPSTESDSTATQVEVPRVSQPEADIDHLPLPDLDPPSLSDLDDLLSSPRKTAQSADFPPAAPSANIGADEVPAISKKSALPQLNSFPAVFEYRESRTKTVANSNDNENLGRSATSSIPDKQDQPIQTAFINNAEDEKFWVECALGIRKLDASDSQFSTLSSEMQRYIRQKLGLSEPESKSEPISEIVPVQHLNTVEAAKPYNTVTTQSSSKDGAKLSGNPIPAFLPPSLARHASKEAIQPSSSSISLTTSSTSETTPPRIQPHRSSSTTSNNSASSRSSTTTTLGSPIKLASETPSRVLDPKERSTLQAAPDLKLPYIWEYTSPSRPYAYDFDFIYETNRVDREPSFGYMDSSASSSSSSRETSRESSVEVGYVGGRDYAYQVKVEEEYVSGAYDGTTPTEDVSFATWKPASATLMQDADYTWRTDASTDSKSQVLQLKLPDFVFTPPTPLQLS